MLVILVLLLLTLTNSGVGRRARFLGVYLLGQTEFRFKS